MNEPNGRMDRLERRIEKLEDDARSHIHRSEVWSAIGGVIAIVLVVIAILNFGTG